MKNLFIVKGITEDKNISDDAFAVWCALRNVIQKDITKYFISYNMIAYSLFDRIPNKYELNAIKKGYLELIENNLIKVVDAYSKSEQVVDLTILYERKDNEYFSDLTDDEMHKIMNIQGKHDKYKLLRYFTCQIGSFNRSENMKEYRGKIGGNGLDYFVKLISISKPTIISFNDLLKENKLLYVIRHKDFYQGFDINGGSELREIPNTYSRWCDRELAMKYSEKVYGYKSFYF